LRAIIGRPDLELVGVHAASSEKIGRDAAELCGLDQPTGIFATDDVDVLVDLGADCVVYTSQGETRPIEAIDQMANFLAAGTNVVASSMVWLVTPYHAEDGYGCRWSAPARPATPPSTLMGSTQASLGIHWSIPRSA
jgi:hypothetical protein